MRSLLALPRPSRAREIHRRENDRRVCTRDRREATVPHALHAALSRIEIGGRETHTHLTAENHRRLGRNSLSTLFDQVI